MDARYYCQTVSADLTAIKARLYGIMREMESSPEAREAASSEIEAMNRLVDEITGKIQSLSVECPVEWNSARKDIEDTKNALTEKIDQWDVEHIAGGYLGG